jgi:hypothetical protein
MDCKIITLGIFLILPLSGAPDQAEAQSSSPASTAASSAFRLIGTIEGAHLSGAVIEDAAGVQTFYLLQERLPDGSKILTVRSDSVVIEQADGARAELIVSPGPARAAVPHRPVPDEPPARDIRSPEPVPGQNGHPKRPRSRHPIEEE